MIQIKTGYPFQYGDELTPEMARENRKAVYVFVLNTGKKISVCVVLTYTVWSASLEFCEPIHSYSSFSNESKMVIVRGVKSSRVNSISRGGDLGTSGPGPRAKADALKNARKTEGGSIFAQGFTPYRQYCSRPSNKPLLCRNNVKINQEQFNGNQNPGRSSSSMETMSKRLSQEYKEYQQKFNSPPLSQRFDTKQYDQERFKELAKDPKANKEVFHKTTVDEARTAIHAEIEGLVDNAQRIEQPICKSVDLDFKVDGPAPYRYMDAKHPVGSEILRKQGQTIDINTMAYRMGNEIMDQKERFCGLEQGPESSENILHIVDLAYVPSHEKEIVKEYCLKGVGSSEGIKFLNDK
jgi:hypothetical protein